MEYCYTNSFDFPSVAFRKGRGYCWQQAKALHRILRGLGFRSRLVFAIRNRFPAATQQGLPVPERVSGHVWCRVAIEGTEKDVCPGSPANTPGTLDFVPLGRVKRWNAPLAFLCYFASAHTNRVRYRALLEQTKNNPPA